MKKVLKSRRLIGAVLFLAVFFLPLHSHSFTPTAQFSKECSCVHGNRTQIGLATASVDWTPAFEPAQVVFYEPEFSVWFSVDSHSIRAPPSASSL
jgi:hypothetical protein